MTRLPAKYSESTCHPSHSQEVIDAARREIDLLLRQRKAISQRLKTVQRTVKGLTTLFGEGHAKVTVHRSADQPDDFSGERLETIPLSNRLSPVENSDEKTAVPRKTEGSSELAIAEKYNLRLDRACRIALLESETPATAEEVYDRIIRRGSYHLNRYKYPLLQVLGTLNRLTETGHVENLAERDRRLWRWNGRFQDDAISASPVPTSTPQTNNVEEDQRIF